MMKKTSASLLALLLSSGPAAAQTDALVRVAVAGGVRGKVAVLGPLPKKIGRVVASGQDLYLHDMVSTGANGSVQILFLDQTMATLGPSATMRLEDFSYDSRSGSGKIGFAILKGAFRFITGKIARQDPASMTVRTPVAVLSVRGTIVAGIIDASGGGRFVLLGPGAGNNAGERAGSFSLEGLEHNKGVSVTVSKPGFGSFIAAPGAPPSVPARVPQAVLDSIAQALAPAPAVSKEGAPQRAGAQQGQSGASASEQAGQTTAAAAGGLEATQSIASIAQTLAGTTQTAAQTAAAAAPPGFPSGVSNWNDVRTVAAGVGTFSASGLFTLTLCNGGPCSNQSGSWGYNVNVDFGAHQVSGLADITAYANSNATVVVDHRALSMDFSSLSGNAAFCCSQGGASYTFALLNSGGFAAKKLQGTAAYDNTATNPSAPTQGTGETLTSTRP